MTEQDAPNLGMLIALLREERDGLREALLTIHDCRYSQCGYCFQIAERALLRTLLAPQSLTSE